MSECTGCGEGGKCSRDGCKTCCYCSRNMRVAAPPTRRRAIQRALYYRRKLYEARETAAGWPDGKCDFCGCPKEDHDGDPGGAGYCYKVPE